MDMTLYAQWETTSAVNRASDRIHAGLMSLATAQAGAMRELGTKFDDRLVQIDETILAQSEQLSAIGGAIEGLRSDMRTGFIKIANRISRLDAKLDELVELTSKPEETLAWERFHRAAELLKKGHGAEALEHVDHAISNGDGPAFRHIPQFHLLRGQILMGGFTPRDVSVVDFEAAHAAFMQAAIHLEGEGKAIAFCRAGAAAYLDRDFALAEKAYLEALQIPHAVQFTHFELAKCSLHLGKEREMKHHLLHAVDRDWKMIALVASDETLLTRANRVERILTAYRQHVMDWIGGGLKALQHVASGPTQRNIEKMWSVLDGAIAGTRLPDLDPDLEAFQPPTFRPPYGDPLNKVNDKLSDLGQGWLDLYARIAREDVGLLDIQHAFGDNSFVEISARQISAAKFHLQAFRSALSFIESGKTPFEGSSGIQVRSEAKERAWAKERAKYIETRPKGRGPKWFGRVTGRTTGKDWTELRKIMISEEKRLEQIVAKDAMSVAPVIATRCEKSSDIVNRAEQSLTRITAVLEGRKRLLKPSPHIPGAAAGDDNRASA